MTEESRTLFGYDAFTDDELRGGQADVRGQTCQVANEGGTGQEVDLGIPTGHDGALPPLKGRSFAPGIG
jgi:hypothetical protein